MVSEPHTVIGAVGKFWWLFLLQGVAAVVVGIALVVVPGRSLLFIALVFGIYLMLWGTLHLIGAILIPGERAIRLLVGVAAILAGVLVAGDTERTTLFLTLAFGLFLIIWGAVSMVAAFEGESNRVLRIVQAIASLIAGILVIAWPGPSLFFLALVFGFYLIFVGILEIVAAFKLRSAGHRAEAGTAPAA